MEGFDLAQKKSYSRYFIILQEEEKGYSLASDKLPSGYTKLEIKNERCKISYYVQNLKKERQPYYMVLICCKKGVDKIINLGQLNIDEYGRTEISYEYPCEDIGGSNISVDKIIGAAIVKFEGKFLISVMSGFSIAEIPDWKGLTVFARSEEQAKEKNEFDKYESVIENIKQIGSSGEEENTNINSQPEVDKRHEGETVVMPEETTQVIPETVPQETPQVTPEMTPQEIPQTVPELAPQETPEAVPGEVPQQIPQGMPGEMPAETPEQSSGVLPQEYQQEMPKASPQEMQRALRHEEILQQVTPQEVPEVSPQETMPEMTKMPPQENILKESEHKCDSCNKKTSFSASIGKFFMGVVDGFKEIDDFCPEIKKCKWYEVKVKNADCLYDTSDYNKYTAAYYPMISYYPYIRNYGHYLFGLKCDAYGKPKYIVYGVPGTRHKSDQPYEGKSGFVTWVPQNPDEDDIDSFGYWLMFYDYKNATIVVPVK